MGCYLKLLFRTQGWIFRAAQQDWCENNYQKSSNPIYAACWDLLNGRWCLPYPQHFAEPGLYPAHNGSNWSSSETTLVCRQLSISGNWCKKAKEEALFTFRESCWPYWKAVHLFFPQLPLKKILARFLDAVLKLWKNSKTQEKNLARFLWAESIRSGLNTNLYISGTRVTNRALKWVITIALLVIRTARQAS